MVVVIGRDTSYGLMIFMMDPSGYFIKVVIENICPSRGGI